MSYLRAKRFFDVFFSLALLILLSPLFAAIALSVLFSSGFPILYKGIRSGQYNCTFNIYKFRTMLPNAESLGGYSTALKDPRLTPVGRILRKYKLDELPQLVNVLKGDMSFVGPRPQVLYYTKKYTGSNLLLLNSKPGITDLATLKFFDMDSVLGSHSVDILYEESIEPQKNRLRCAYSTNASLTLDLLILLSTLLSLLHIDSLSRYLISHFEDA